LSLKENIDLVKEELNSEEKFFEKAVITEKFVNKYKNAIIGGVVAVVIAVGANIAYEANKSATLEEANEVLATLLSDPKNVQAKSALESLSPQLHDVWNFSQAIALNDTASLERLKSSKTPIIGDLSSYELASKNADAKGLIDYSMNQKAVYKDLAIVQSAILLLDKNEIEKAHLELKKISQSSGLNKVVSALLHYGVK